MNKRKKPSIHSDCPTNSNRFSPSLISHCPSPYHRIAQNFSEKNTVEGRMKEKILNRSSTTGNSRDTDLSLSASFTEDELIVVDILVNFKFLIPLSDSLANCNWTSKRRRSLLDDPSLFIVPPSRPSTSGTKIEAAAVVAPQKDNGAARPTTSPDTPLCFSPSDESHEKSSKKTSRKRLREKYLDMIEIQTENRESLRREIQNVKKYYENLKSQNSELKAKLQEAQRKIESQTEVTGNHRINTASFQGQLFEYSDEPIIAHSNKGTGSVNHVGPRGFDLNLPPEEEECDFGGDLSQPLDVSSAVADKQARYAEARRKRRNIIKIKFHRNGV